MRRRRAFGRSTGYNSGEMAEPKPFLPVKLICGAMASDVRLIGTAEDRLAEVFGPIDRRSPLFDFDTTDYYTEEMGGPVKRTFLSFQNLVPPTRLASIKLRTNELEETIRKTAGLGYRAVNLDPGYVTPSALIMATTKNFAHRVPLADGIYAHLELLFVKTGVKHLEWTYPDYRRKEPEEFFLGVRRAYLEELKRRIGE